jgi:ferritin
MISKKMQNSINEQIKYELESAYLYMAMGAWFQMENYDGMARWMNSQAVEEMGHALRFQNHLIDRDAKVTLKPLNMIKTEWTSPLDAFSDALAHEKKVTKRIHALVQQADAEKDKALLTFLEWFVNEQVEEESTASKIVTDLERNGDFGYGLIMLDRELGQRQITLPVLATEA